MIDVGIERIRFYPTTLRLNMTDLCAARGFDEKYVLNDLQINARSVHPAWEDPVTAAVNVAKPMLEGFDLDSIGLLIVSSESAVDQEKPMSSWVHRYLGLNARCRNFEVKYACYGMTGALQIALGWLSSPAAGGKKVLLISTDQSVVLTGKPYEPCTGAGAVAVVLSREPRLLKYELGKSGVHASEIADVFRPTPKIEMGNSETSLFSYLEGLEGAFENYRAVVPEAEELDAHFDWHVYHTPFPGMGERAHRTVLASFTDLPRAEVRAHFERKVAPAVAFSRRTGGCYGASTFLGLISLAQNADIKAGERVGVFAYGSGSCAELQSAIVGEQAKAAVAEARFEDAMQARRVLSVAEFDRIEAERDRSLMAQEFRPDLNALGEWYEQRYAGRQMLVLDRIEDYYRHYRWS